MTLIRPRPARAAQGLVVLAAAASVAAACDAPPPPPAPPVAAPAFTPAPAAVELRLPFDAAPSHDGDVIFYTALGSDEQTHSLWSVPFDGGDARELATGFAAPLGIAVSPNDDVVYVADAGDERPAADDAESEAGDQDLGTGALFAVPFTGGTATRIASVDRFAIRGMDVVDDGGDVVTFTGKDPADGAPALARLDIAREEVTVVAKGAPLSDPSGVVVDEDGAFVVDTSAADDGRAALLRVKASGAVTTVASGIRAGTPAGIAFSPDGAALFVSSLDEDGQAQVTIVDRATGATSTVNEGLEGNDEAGGLHKARDAEVYAWAGAKTVYAITFE